MKLPAGPSKTPRVFRLLKLIFRPIEYMDDYQHRYGDIFAILGRKNIPIVYISHPEAIQQIFNADFGQVEDIGGGSKVLQYLLGDNSLLFVKGDRHRRQRQLLTPSFHGERMRTYGQLICEIAQRVATQWSINQPFRLRHSMQEISLEVILQLVFGLEKGERHQQIKQLLTRLLESFNSPIFSSLFFFDGLQKDFGAWSPWGHFIREKQKLDEVLYAEIQERRQHFDPMKTDIFTLLMMAKDETGQGMSDEELRDELMTLLLAGHETTASALTWAFYWVDRHPEVREKLLHELSTLSPNADPNTIAKLPYLSAVCSETLRIYPITLTTFVRIVRSPLKIFEYEFPAGTVLFPCIYMAHHREEVYPNAKQFKPERFLEKQYSPYEYFPFGGGNRRCIGMAFAQYEMKLVLATLLSQYQLTLADKRPVRPVRRGPTISPPGTLRMVATPLKQKIPTPV